MNIKGLGCRLCPSAGLAASLPGRGEGLFLALRPTFITFAGN